MRCVKKDYNKFCLPITVMGVRLFPFLFLQMLGGRLCRSFQSCKHLRCRPCTVNQSSLSLGVTAAAYQKNVDQCYSGHTNSDRFLHGKRYPISGLKDKIEDILLFLLNMSLISRVKWTIFIFHEWQSHE